MVRWSSEQVEAEIARLRDLTLEQRRGEGRRQMRPPPPACFKSDLLFRALAYQLQVKAFGGLDRATERLLDRLAETDDPTAVLASLRQRRLKPGTEFIRGGPAASTGWSRSKAAMLMRDRPTAACPRSRA